MADLSTYRAKRDFAATPEPDAPGTASALAPRYSMQKHAARRLHFDLRLEHDGVLLSFAVTRGPSLDPAERRLAVRTEDHPLSYLDFEGTIPAGNYGAGTVMLWDIGHWQPYHDVAEGLAKGHIHFALHGARLTGGWNLVRLARDRSGGSRENWLLIKDDDDAAHRPDPVATHLTSIGSGRAMTAIAEAKAPVTRSRRAARPRFRKPQLADKDGSLADRDGRWFELKLDGYRAQVALGKGGPRIFTRSGKDWSDRFAPLLPLVDALPARSALIDAEIVAGAGLQGFSALQAAIGAGGPFRLVAFDLLAVDGRDLAGRPLSQRRARLERLFADVPPLGLLRLSPVIDSDVEHAFALICDNDGEGLISKRVDAPYRAGRSRDWTKIRCARRDDFVVVGLEPSTSRGRPFGSLLLAAETADGLAFRGRVGTGWNETDMAAIESRLAPLVTREPPLRVPRPARGTRWVAPRARVEVRYTEITPEGRLRHPVWQGFRDDLPPPRTVRANIMDEKRETIAGVPLSSPERVVFPKPRTTKRMLARYVEDAAPLLLDHAAGRPLTLVRLPDGLGGERFFQKHLGQGFPDGIEAATRPGKDGEDREVMTTRSARGLVAAVQMGAVEFHIGGARLDLPDKPDRLVLDLDPDEGLSFARLKRAAIEVADDLRALGLDPWPLATGGKGIHVVVPLRRSATWETVTLFARTYAALKETAHPDRFVASAAKARRSGRIYLDWLRNEPGASAIAPFSPRARDGGPIAHPLSWDELAAARAMPRRSVARPRLDDLARPAAKPRAITAAVIDALARLAG